VSTRSVREIKNALAVAQAVADPYTFIRPHGGALAVFTSKSIRYETLGHAAFNRLNTGAPSPPSR